MPSHKWKEFAKNDPDWPFTTLDGFKFRHVSKETRTMLEALVRCSKFTSLPSHVRACSREDYALRFQNNVSVVFKALMLNGEFYGACEFWDRIREDNRGFSLSTAAFKGITQFWIQARNTYIRNASLSRRRGAVPGVTETARLVDEWLAATTKSSTRGTGSSFEPSTSQLAAWDVIRRTWVQMCQDGSLKNVSQPEWRLSSSRPKTAQQ
ncbi:hypothetical protein B0T25DRAFT_268843 [Lasiosphaeria hispida]|uniref:Uncharacterized protein n=1 Tax=Lasiosphaeria hispida TaxID=260671 RepID=A0AAJ0HAN2_9PEZI|nr:hypothetical protein B0T25DRAFT_268843 [Lasiosphaeria hispida]